MADETKDDAERRRALDMVVTQMEKLQVNATLNLEAIMSTDRGDMAEQCMTRFAEASYMQALVLYTITSTCPQCPRDEETGKKTGRCKLCDIINMTGMLSTYAVSSVVGAMAKWNALHPSDKPLGNAANLAVVAEALNKQSN